MECRLGRTRAGKAHLEMRVKGYFCSNLGGTPTSQLRTCFHSRAFPLRRILAQKDELSCLKRVPVALKVSTKVWAFHYRMGSTTVRNGNRWKSVSRVQIRLMPCSRINTAV